MKKLSVCLFLFITIFFISCEELLDEGEKDCNFSVFIQKSEGNISGTVNKFRIITGWITNKNDYTTSLITIYVYGDNGDYARVKPNNQSLKSGEKSLFSTGWISGRGPTKYEYFCD